MGSPFPCVLENELKGVRKIYNKFKNAHKVIHLCLALLILLSVTSGVAFFGYDNPETTRASGFWSHEAPPRFVGVPVGDGQVIQEFTAQKGRFAEFILFLEGYAPEDEGTAHVKLEDRDGNVLYYWTAPISAMGGETFCLLGYVNQNVHRGEIYSLRIWLEGESDMTVRAIDDGDCHESVADVTVDGQVLPGTKLYFSQSYETVLVYAHLWLAAIAVTLMVLILVIWCQDRKMKMALKALCDVALILVSYVSIELLSGNLFTIQLPYALLNVLILAGSYWAIRVIVGKAAYYIVALLTFAAGITDHYVLLFKGTDFLLTEISAFSTAMSVTGNYDFTFPPVVFTAVLLYLCLILMRVAVDLTGEKVPVKRILKNRAVALTGCLAAVLLLSWGMKSVVFDYFNLGSNFQKYGWWYSNAIVLKNSQVKKPADYSDKEIERILAEVTAPESQAVKPKNIIAIMNEALGDLSMLGQLDTNQDYLPFIRSLTENTIKGNLHVQPLGGGTCITEYEFLTGNTFHFMPMGSMPYAKSNNAQGEPGIASALKEQGYATVAMHPYGPKNWNRDQVYEAMGFDEFISIDDFEGAERVRNFVSDRANYDKIIEIYESHKGENLFLFNVTMQNHGGYEIDNGTMDTTISIGNIDSKEAEIYLSLMKESDEAFEYLISYFSKVEEPTMIVMFGDHLPALSEAFYTALYGKADADQTDRERSLKFVTPYIIWTNYDSDFEAVPETSPNYLGRLVLQYAGAELSRYDRFILNQREKVPVIGKYGLVDQAGNYQVYREDLEPLLQDYQVLQYLRVKDSDSKYRDIFHIKN